MRILIMGMAIRNHLTVDACDKDAVRRAALFLNAWRLGKVRVGHARSCHGTLQSWQEAAHFVIAPKTRVCIGRYLNLQ